ncbi:MAG: hypothetical protein P4L69_18480 [Desulfosporosinus sp.]|nr:hypothetical protein [Desulfosporosinus sp.]
MWAPSGSNNQSWLFTAVQNKEALAKISVKNLFFRKGSKGHARFFNCYCHYSKASLISSL